MAGDVHIFRIYTLAVSELGKIANIQLFFLLLFWLRSAAAAVDVLRSDAFLALVVVAFSSASAHQCSAPTPRAQLQCAGATICAIPMLCQMALGMKQQQRFPPSAQRAWKIESHKILDSPTEANFVSEPQFSSSVSADVVQLYAATFMFLYFSLPIVQFSSCWWLASMRNEKVFFR